MTAPLLLDPRRGDCGGDPGQDIVVKPTLLTQSALEAPGVTTIEDISAQPPVLTSPPT